MHRVTLLLVAIATALVQAVLAERDPGAGIGLLAMSIGLAGSLALAGRRLSQGALVASVLLIALLPVPWDAISRVLFRVGAPYEVQLAYVLRNMMLALVATPLLPRATALATLASFFLVVFGFLWSTGPWAIGLLVAYSIVGAWWLFVAYWERLGGRFADRSERSMPVRPAVAAVGILGLLALGSVPLVKHTATTAALAGFFPSSGGTQSNDPFAHGGVGDGDQMVAAKDQASSFGPIDSELFLESQMPSLYDTFNEFSEETKRKKGHQRAIPLAPSQMQTNHQKRGQTQEAKREFSTVRKSKNRLPTTEDRLSAALLLVKGRTPLHLALETYDRWDGRRLHASSSETSLKTTLERAYDDRLWLSLFIHRPSDVFSGAGSSQVRVVNLKTDRVPTPAGVQRATLKGLHAASMFKFATDGSLAMDAKRIPQLTVFEFQSGLRGSHTQPRLAATEPNADWKRVAHLASEWTNGIPAGWRQVEEVVAHLRRDYTHDPSAMVPEKTDDAVEHFLFESKRGPDYLFAASAAVMLHSLGYDTRVRSGFYASPSRYERASQLTPVLAEDAHFWVEMLTSNGSRVTSEGETLAGVWVTVEPTPGYEVLYAPETLLARVARHLTALFRAALAQPVVTALVILCVGLVYTTRRRLMDATLLAWWWTLSRTLEVERLASLTLRLLEWRAWAHSRRRPVGTTLGNWETLRSHDDFVGLVSWALYGSGAQVPLDTQAAREACRRAIHTPMAPTRASKKHGSLGDTAWIGKHR